MIQPSQHFRPLFYLLLPLFAILACNAPVDRLRPPNETEVPRPTIGPPPTLTPIALVESEFIIVTAIILPTDTPTPNATNTLTAEQAADTPTPIPTNTLLPTVTLDPDFATNSAQNSGEAQAARPITFLYVVDWEINRKPTETPTQDLRPTKTLNPKTPAPTQTLTLTPSQTPTPTRIRPLHLYAGRLIFVSEGGSGVFAYYVDGERINDSVIGLEMKNCAILSMVVRTESLNSEPVEEEITINAPCR